MLFLIITTLTIVMIYPVLRSFMFTMQPEKSHSFSMESMQKINKFALGRGLLRAMFTYKNANLERNILGLRFINPVGLAAGFDKNATYLHELQSLGFGFVEIGTVTPRPQPGNEQPRLFRLPADKAIINRMGFNNDGVEIVRTRLELFHKHKKNNDLIIGGNIGKNKVTPNENAWKDYVTCFNELFDVVDYFVVNVSSPNTPGLRELQDKDSLRKIFTELQNINGQKQKSKPILLKIAPDLTENQLNDIIALADEINLDGLVATNTTISREGLTSPKSKVEALGAGGLSGKPLQKRSTEVVRSLAANLRKKIPVIASGGIFTAEDAKEKLNAGADLVQVYTGFIYQGPSITKDICKGLV